MKSMVFHIGVPKTGSSALQVFLARNQKALYEHGVDYLKIGEFAMGASQLISSGNGAHLSRCILPDMAHARLVNPDPYITEFFNAVERSDCEMGVVSSELFVDADKGKFESLLETLRGMGITPKVFYFIRRQDDFLVSAYIQQVKRHKSTKMPDEYLLSAYRRIRYLKFYSYYEYISEIFGADNVFIDLYDEGLKREGGIFGSFLDMFSISREGISLEMPKINSSIKTHDLAIMLALNRYQPRMQFSDMITENIGIYSGYGSDLTVGIFSKKILGELYDYFAEENRYLAEVYFKRPTLFAPQPELKEEETAALDHIDAAGVVDCLGGILVRLDQKFAHMSQRLEKVEKILAGFPQS